MGFGSCDPKGRTDSSLRSWLVDLGFSQHLSSTGDCKHRVTAPHGLLCFREEALVEGSVMGGEVT